MGVPVVRGPAMRSSAKVPERMRTVSGSRLWVVKRDWPGRRRSRWCWMSASVSAMPGGQPSTTQPMATPWLSPKVVMRSIWPKLLKDMAKRAPEAAKRLAKLLRVPLARVKPIEPAAIDAEEAVLRHLELHDFALGEAEDEAAQDAADAAMRHNDRGASGGSPAIRPPGRARRHSSRREPGASRDRPPASPPGRCRARAHRSMAGLRSRRRKAPSAARRASPRSR